MVNHYVGGGVVMKIPKVRIDVWIEADDYNRIIKYAGVNGLKNPSQAIQKIIIEWRRFTAILKQHQQKQEEDHLNEVAKAKVVKQ